MIQQLRNSFLTWYGCADVPMSKSFGRRPSSRSRTAPSATPQALAICFGTAGIGLGMMKCVMSLPFSLAAARPALIAGGTIFE